LSRECTGGVEEAPIKARAVHFAENRQAFSEDFCDGIFRGYEDRALTTTVAT
jgi:hypothetical protein